MKNLIVIIVLTIFLGSCKNDSESKNLTDQEKQAMDSVSRIEQRKKGDSLKRKNPLLIIPPDSNFTGDYVDKYPSGIVKFKGFFRFGERHGQWMSFYPNGILWSELSYDKGLREGPNTTYYLNSKKRYEGFYRDDKQDSVWSYYDTTGVIAEKVLYKKDVIIKKLPLK